MRIFAIADLHLSFARPKPMDVFGAHWTDHPVRLAQAWRARVGPGDLVLVGGDLSWAVRPAEAVPDLAWLAALPGRKVLVKGNHDYWYPGSHAKRAALLGPTMDGLYRTSAVIGDVGVVGGRGPDLDPPPGTEPEAAATDADRQLRALEASVVHLEARGLTGLRRVALLHHPPTRPGEATSPVTELLERSGVRLCCFGHLHTAEDHAAAIAGVHGGIRYCLTSADHLCFEPLDVTDFLGA